jgi:hypothetical protein
MDAPLYPPSAYYEAPIRVPTQMTTRDSSFADFLANPEALAIIKGEVPAFEGFIKAPQLQPHLGNMGPRDMVQFGVFKADALDRVDARLKAAGIMQ